MDDGAGSDAERGSGRSAETPDGAALLPDLLESLTRLDRELDHLHTLLEAAELDPQGAAVTAPGALRTVVERVERLRRRLAAGALRAVRIGSTVEAGRADGFTDTGAWFARTTRTDRRDAAQQTRLAGMLCPTPPGQQVEGEPNRVLTQGAPLTRAALDAGELSLAHARIIVAVLMELPERLSVDEAGAIEAHLVNQARRVDPSTLRKLARRALAAIEPDPVVVDEAESTQLQAEEEAAYRASSFWIRDNCDGTMTGHFTVPWFSGVALKTVLDAMTAPRRGSARSGSRKSGTTPQQAASMSHSSADARAQDCGAGSLTVAGSDTGAATDAHGVTGHFPAQGAGTAERGESSWKNRELDWQQRWGRAFADLLTMVPTEHLPNKAAATIVVQTDLDVLRAQLEKAGVTSCGDSVSAAQVRRLACQAAVVPAVMGSRSVPLDLGRSSRLFTQSQRLALSARYDACCAAGCDRPFAWSQIHHLIPWERGGLTDLWNAIPLCGLHHRLLHSDRRYQVTRDALGRVTITFDPARAVAAA